MFRVTDEAEVRILTLDNPARRNAIPTDGWEGLAAALRSFEESDARVLVITGAGEHFCSGADLGSTLGSGLQGAVPEIMSRVGDAAVALHDLTKPTVAAVDGYAVGAGMNLAIGCDIVLASDRARFSEVFVKRGLTVDFGGTWLLPRRVGMARAKELALTGRVVDAAEALEMGMVSRIVPPDRLAEEAHALAVELAAGAPLAQRFIKAAMDRSFDMSFEQAISLEHTAQGLLFTTEDVAEGLAAFLARRDPEFRGR